MTSSRYFSLILILGSLTALGPFTIDMYLPGFQAIAKDLHTDVSQVGLTLSSYFIGLAGGQLLYGPLLDRFGRKPPLFAGLFVYIIASLACVWARSVESLIVIRLIQALGGCAAAVAAVAMVRDLFPVSESAKVFALLMLVVGASPMVAPTVGGYVTSAFGWQAVFMILCGMGVLVLLASIFWLPASYRPDTSFSLKPAPIIRNFLSVIKVPQFYTYTIAGALAFAGLFVYVAGSPKVFMDGFHLSDRTYGWIFAMLSVGFIGSNQVNTLLLRRYTSEQIILAALACQVLIAAFFLLASMNDWLGLGGSIAALFPFLCCVGLINPNAAALSMAPFEKNAGSASSLMGALQLGIGALASTMVGIFKAANAVPMAATMAATAALGLIVLLLGRRNIVTEIMPNFGPE